MVLLLWARGERDKSPKGRACDDVTKQIHFHMRGPSPTLPLAAKCSLMKQSIRTPVAVHAFE